MLSVPHGLLPFIPVTYDNSVQSAYQNFIASGANFQWTHSATAGAYAIVVILQAGGLTHQGTLAATVTTMTFGGTTMTSLGNVYSNNDSTQGYAWAFGLANVTGGSNTVSVTLTQAGQNFDGYAVSFTYNGVASVGTLQTAFGSSSPQTLSVSSAPGNMVWGASCQDAGAFNSCNLVPRQQNSSQFPQFVAGDLPGASTVKIVTSATPFDWCAVGLNLVHA